MNEFKLKAPYKPTGDQPQAMRNWSRDLKKATQCETFLVLLVPVRLLQWQMSLQQLNKPTLIIAHNKTLAAQLYGEFKEFFPKTQWNILSPTTTTTSRKLMCLPQTLTLPRTPLTMRSINSVSQPQRPYVSGKMLSWFRRYPVFMAWVHLRIIRYDDLSASWNGEGS